MSGAIQSGRGVAPPTVEVTIRSLMGRLLNNIDIVEEYAGKLRASVSGGGESSPPSPTYGNSLEADLNIAVSKTDSLVSLMAGLSSKVGG